MVFVLSAPELPQTPVTRETLLDFLSQCGFETKTHDHPAFFTVEDGKDFKDGMPGGHTKNLFLKDKKSRYFLLTAQEDTQINLKTLHKLLGGSGRFSFGNADMMVELLGVTPGAVTALGVINDREHSLTFAIDKRLLENEVINCHPLTNEATTAIKRDDLLKFAQLCGHEPLVVDLSEEV